MPYGTLSERAIASRSRSVPQGYVHVPQPNLRIKEFFDLPKVLRKLNKIANCVDIIHHEKFSQS
jgi:hypothetical protein